MHLKSFEDHLDRYGGHLEDWPQDIRLAAQDLVSRSQRAAHLLRLQRTIDAALLNLPKTKAPANLADRISQAARDLSQASASAPTKPATASGPHPSRQQKRSFMRRIAST